jgi:tRNA threonylcarbamoyl adenosine modification protein (Sua5/YciO/YrdC/YwlC family)
MLQSKKETIGLRVPDNKIARCIVKELGHPILSASLPGDQVEEYTDPEVINEKFGSRVDMVIDGGMGGTVSSTIVDCTEDIPVVLRQGAGAWAG